MCVNLFILMQKSLNNCHYITYSFYANLSSSFRYHAIVNSTYMFHVIFFIFSLLFSFPTKYIFLSYAFCHGLGTDYGRNVDFIVKLFHYLVLSFCAGFVLPSFDNCENSWLFLSLYFSNPFRTFLSYFFLYSCSYNLFIYCKDKPLIAI